MCDFPESDCTCPDEGKLPVCRWPAVECSPDCGLHSNAGRSQIFPPARPGTDTGDYSEGGE
jgi:hypothetical protein